MIATLPMEALAPLDYRYALDAARSVFGPHAMPLVRCNLAELDGETGQRFSRTAESIADGALWIEPLVDSWRSQLADLAHHLPAGAPLVVIVSQPMARMVPERQAWRGQALGMRPTGINALLQGLRAARLTLEARHGFHTPTSILLNQIGSQAARLGRPDLSDRLHFAARLRYCSRGSLAALATVTLLTARREK